MLFTFRLRGGLTVYLYQNEFMPKADVHISPDDRGYYFGDGVYEVFRVYNGQLFEAQGHYRRLQKSAAETFITIPYTIDQLNEKLAELIRLNQLQEGTVYMQITRGSAQRAHPFPLHTAPVLMAYCTETARPVSAMEHGISAVTFDDIRWLRCDLKTLNLLPNIMAKQHALNQGAGEVILHRSGVVTECSASNFMIVNNGELHTHPANNLILHGITREVVIRLAKQLEIPVHETSFTLNELSTADEAFVTGTTVEVTPVISVNQSRVGQGMPGPVTRRLQHAFADLIGI
jgi:D-alanine transaminase